MAVGGTILGLVGGVRDADELRMLHVCYEVMYMIQMVVAKGVVESHNCD
jgi:hypothetical protein